MKSIKLFEYFHKTTDIEVEYKNELIRLNTKYSGIIPAQTMVDWLEASIDILKAKAQKEKNKNRYE